MTGYTLYWFILILLSLLGSISLVALGCYLVRVGLNDLSNSTTGQAYALRAVRLLPGVALGLFGCVLVACLVLFVVRLPIPRP